MASGAMLLDADRVIFEAQGGTTYFFQVGGIFGGGSLEFHVDEILPPPRG